MTETYKIIDGKKYVLVEDQAVDSKPEPEIFQRLTSPPRSVSIAVRLLLLLRNGSAPLVGWIFACFGMIFCIVFLPWATNSLTDLTHRRFDPAGKGEILDIVKTGMHVNDRPVCRIVFKKPDGETGQCYASEVRFKIGDEVDLQKSDSFWRIEGTSLTAFGWTGVFVGFVMIFPLIGLGIVLYGFFKGRKAIRLLQDGEVGRGLFVEMNPTGAVVNGCPVMKLHYIFESSDGEPHDAFATALDTKKLTDDSVEPLFYDPMDPKQSVLLDSLPAGIRFDEYEGTFKANIFRTFWPVFFCGLFLAECVVLFHAIARGGIVPLG